MSNRRKRILRGAAFYIGGLVLGAFLVNQLWWKKRPDIPNMWPEGRVKDQIKRSMFIVNDTATCYLQCYQLNDSLVKAFVSSGDVRFGISKPRRKPHPVYIIDGAIHEGWKVRMHIESADSTAILWRIEDLPGTQVPKSCSCPEFNY